MRFNKIVINMATVALLTSPIHSASAGVIASTMSNFEDSFLTAIRAAMEEAASFRGVETYVDDADNSQQLQLQQIQEFVDAGVDAILVTPVTADPEYNEELMDIAAEGSIPLVYVNVQPEIERLPEKVAFVGSNELASGTMQMEELARRAQYSGQVALLRGNDKHPSTKIRSQDVHQVVYQYPGMSIVAEASANGDRSEALTQVSQWLAEGKEFNIIVANNDEMAIGAIMALRQASKNPADYLIGGIDASRDALDAMAKGWLAVTVLQDAQRQAEMAISIANDLMRGREVESRTWISFKLVTPSNLSDFTN
ncbi:substrate-binding domain-containing protein [Oceanobacter mangrovi]|uniref:substrate-binding domain-containing protein n=1 Tax=Oceanobacter mangrovi TaxID=2862510 RepID=UPI001C8E563A|nr:substrate-binding domain-containing protein [Oceanobacter mangrovi]